jgi:hypothetical protein
VGGPLAYPSIEIPVDNNPHGMAHSNELWLIMNTSYNEVVHCNCLKKMIDGTGKIKASLTTHKM